ncbi:MAG: HdeD family acid-resistance protein [Anaerolineae bacterium]
MAHILKQAWWALLLRGIVALLIGLLLLFSPGLTLATGAISFVVLFGVYALVDGVATIFSAVTRREGQWFLLLLLGIVNVVVALIALGNPLIFAVISVTVMIYIVGFKAIAGGIVEMMTAWELRKDIDNEWLLMLNGLFSVLFGLILLARPITGVEVLVIFATFYLLITGVLLVLLAFKVRGWAGKVDALRAEVTAA